MSARYVVEHSGTTEDGPVPAFKWNLLLCEVGADHFTRMRQVRSTRSLVLGFLERAVMILDLMSLIKCRHFPPMIFLPKSAWKRQGREPTSALNWERAVMILVKVVELGL